MRRCHPLRTCPGSANGRLRTNSLTQRVQQQLGDAEKVDKNDDSPVTVADYGAAQRHLRPPRVQPLEIWALARAPPACSAREWAAGLSTCAHTRSMPLRGAAPDLLLLRMTTRSKHALHAGAHLLLAAALQRADPGSKLSMVAEEDSASLKCGGLQPCQSLPCLD